MTPERPKDADPASSEVDPGVSPEVAPQGRRAQASSSDLDILAGVASDIARGRSHADALADRGLDEEAFDAASTRAEQELSDAIESASDSEVAPPTLAAFDRALRAAVAAPADPRPGRTGPRADVPSLEDFARMMVITQEGGRVDERLAERGFSLHALLLASGHHTPRLARDQDLAARFAELLAAARRGPAA